ncbi:MAG: hypothetical protein Q9220_005293 [cf. Caloplaca sp. 1 TL-2023]
MQDSIRSDPEQVPQPYKRESTLAYGAVHPCVQGMIKRFNNAARQAGQDEEVCGICMNTVTSPEKNAKLALIELPCKHSFHEICLTPWISPVLLPPTTENTSWSAQDLEDGEIPQPDMPQAYPQAHSKNSEERDDDDFGSQNIHLSSREPSSFAEEELPELQRTIPDHRCPMCRRPAFRRFNCFDRSTLQLLRISLRLNNLAYQCFRFSCHGDFQMDLQDFLARRHQDNVALGQHEIIPSPAECGRLFTVARYNLLREVFDYQDYHTLPESELIPMVALFMFYEEFKLKHKYLRYFFDPDPNFNHQSDMVLSWEELEYWRKSPRLFLQQLHFSIAVDDNSGKEGMNIEWKIGDDGWDEINPPDGFFFFMEGERNIEDKDKMDEDDGDGENSDNGWINEYDEDDGDRENSDNGWINEYDEYNEDEENDDDDEMDENDENGEAESDTDMDSII